MTLILSAILWPLFLACLVPFSGCRRWLPWTMPVAVLPALVLAWVGETVGTTDLTWVLTGVVLGVDGLRLSFLWLAALVWLIAGVYAVAYVQSDSRRHRFILFWLLTLAGNIGLILSFDVLSFYSTFALMTFAGYGLVVHTRSDEALVAGRVYLIMAVIGEAFILSGLFAAVAAAGFDPTLSALPGAVGASDQAALISTLLFVGFGVKAGVALLHLWLPLAHPVAPTPASAVLSGVMIKAGLLGWLLMLPLGEVDLATLGAWVILAGMVGSLGAALIGVCQSSPKAVLAYSSVSQMGLMTVLMGVVLGNGHLAAALLPVIALYALHHGLAKGALFLAVSAARPEAFGRWWWLMSSALPGLALAGLPLTSGAAAKLFMKEMAPTSLSLPVGNVDAGLFFSAAAVATTVLVLRFLHQLAAAPVRSSPSPLLAGSALAAIATSLVLFWWIPVTLLQAPLSMIGSAYDAWALTYPLLIGVALAGVVLALRVRAPGIPAGDFVVPVRRVGGRVLVRAMSLLDQRSKALVSQGQMMLDKGLTGALAVRPEPVERWLRRTAPWWFGLLLLLLVMLAR